MIQIQSLKKIFYKGDINEKTALDNLCLHVKRGEFVAVIGGNGAGKSTLLNSIAGVFLPDAGSIFIDQEDMTRKPEHYRSCKIARVFQDPLKGTAKSMTIEENLSLAKKRGKPRGLSLAIRKDDRSFFREQLATLELGLEDRLHDKVGLLSGGQRQALTLLMATMLRPELLLLDEHTAALDPRTAAKVMEITDRLVREHRLTTLMVTHNMENALQFGNRLIMMHEGNIAVDIHEEKKDYEIQDLLNLFSGKTQKRFSNDRVLLSKIS